MIPEITPILILQAPNTKSLDYFVCIGLPAQRPGEPPHVSVLHACAFDHPPTSSDYKALRATIEDNPERVMVPKDMVNDFMLFTAKGRLSAFLKENSQHAVATTWL